MGHTYITTEVRQSAPNGGNAVAIKKVQSGSVAESMSLSPTLVLISVQVCSCLCLDFCVRVRVCVCVCIWFYVSISVCLCVCASVPVVCFYVCLCLFVSDPGPQKRAPRAPSSASPTLSTCTLHSRQGVSTFMKSPRAVIKFVQVCVGFKGKGGADSEKRI